LIQSAKALSSDNGGNVPCSHMTEVKRAASLMGRKSAKVRQEKWGKQEFIRKMQEWGKLGGRPKGSSKQKGKGGQK
jgi:hypothetical protein